MADDKSTIKMKCEGPDRTDVWMVFDRIAHSYDMLNRLLSFGQDLRWRKRVASLVPRKDGLTLLDIATGTGDLMLAVCRKSAGIKSAVGLDMSEKMLDIARRKIEASGMAARLSVVKGSADDLPFAASTFDLVSVAFGIRNVTDVSLALREMNRVLMPGGRALILEFSLPANLVIRKLYLLYFRYVLPLIGGIISGDKQAYRYLNQTVETFPYGEAFSGLMKQAGFCNVRQTPVTFGVATIYEGEKPVSEPPATEEPLELSGALAVLRKKVNSLDLKTVDASSPIEIVRMTVPVKRTDPARWLSAQVSYPRIFWTDRERSLTVAAIGIADQTRSDSTTNIREMISSIRSRLENSTPGPKYYGGRRFDTYRDIPAAGNEWNSFGSACFTLPRIELVDNDKSQVTMLIAINIVKGKDSLSALLESIDAVKEPGQMPETIPHIRSMTDLPDKPGWLNIAGEVIRAVQSDSVKKVVLARKTEITFESGAEPVGLFRRLIAGAEGCYGFYIQYSADAAFFGATPERLFSRDGDVIRSEAVAGTRPRGVDESHDSLLANDLLNSAKEKLEHGYAADSIFESLKGLCSTARMSGGLSITKLSNVQHLVSRMEGTLKPAVRDEDIIQALHPTPAVGGVPVKDALALISKLEPFDRGWYASPIGWISRDSSEFVIGIRSGLMSGNRINLYSGAGIVRGSDPEAEWAELEIKMNNFIKAAKE